MLICMLHNDLSDVRHSGISGLVKGYLQNRPLMVFKKEEHKNYDSTAKKMAYTKYYKSKELF